MAERVRGQRSTSKKWEDYKTADLGEISLPAGNTTLTLRALTNPGCGVANIRAVRLVPVK